MAVRGQEIVSLIKRQIEEFGGDLTLVDVGTVVQVGDGIASIQGLQSVRSNELLDFGNDILGLALNLESDIVGAAILGDPNAIKEGDRVRATGQIIEIPVGEALIGRVVDPLGRPLDGKGPVVTEQTMPVERTAPNVVVRKSVDTPVQTGIKAIDAMIPIGRGQRELIIGDRSTGKTAIAIDTIINQRDTDLICIYVAIGAEAGQGRAGCWHPGRVRGDGPHHRGERRFRRLRAVAVHCALRRLRHGRGFHGRGQGRADRL